MQSTQVKEPVLCHQGVLHVPHLGFTLRSLMGAAIRNHEQYPKSTWQVCYKGVEIAEIRLGKDFQ